LANSSINKVVGFETAGELLRNSHPELLVSKRKLRQAEAIQLVRLNRDGANPNLGFASRPFVLCGLPIKRPTKGTWMHERRNGQFVLQVIGHPNYGVPWGQDRLVPIFLATLAMRQQNRRSRSAALPKCWMCLACSKADPIPAIDSRLSTRVWRNDLLRNGYPSSQGGRGASSAIQLKADDAKLMR
jgi:hypothetical protein